MPAIRTLILTTMFVLPFVSKAETQAKWYPDVKAIVDTRLAERHFVDGAVGVISKTSSKPETATFGAAKLNTLFEIGSISKSFTGIIFAEMVLANSLSAFDPVEKYIPELAGTFAGQIKLADLATHTSGLSRMPSDIPQTLNPYSDYSWEKLLAYLKTAKQNSEPKPNNLDYSNTGFALLGKVLEVASKESYSDLLKKRILIPLNMTDTCLQVPPAKLARFIAGYWSDLTPMPHWDWLVFAPTGGIRSTTSDMIKYIKANLHIKKSNLGKAMDLSQKNNWGWDSQILKLPFPFKNGATYGFNSSMFIDHQRQAAAIILTNISYESDSLLAPILKANNP